MSNKPKNGSGTGNTGGDDKDPYISQLIADAAESKKKQKDAEALSAEFILAAQNGDNWTTEKIREEWAKILPEAFASLRQMLTDISISDAVRLRLLQFIFTTEFAFGNSSAANGIATSVDPQVTNLLKALMVDSNSD